MCISVLGPSSSPSSSLVILFIHSAFSLCFFSCYIFVQNRSVYFASGCWYVFVSLPPNCWSNFLSLFWKVLFCLYCFTLCRYVFNLPSFASTFCFISSSCTVIFSCVASSFFFPAYFSASLFLKIILASFRSLLLLLLLLLLFKFVRHVEFVWWEKFHLICEQCRGGWFSGILYLDVTGYFLNVFFIPVLNKPRTSITIDIVVIFMY